MEQKLMEQKSLGGVIEVPPSSSENTDPTSEKGRRFVFTYFVKDDENVWSPEDMSYMYYGDERCPTTNRRHHQGWFITHNPRSEKAMCKRLGCYVRIMRGLYKHNWKYCSKDGIIKEFGTPPKQGARNDLYTLKEELVNNKTTIEDIVLDKPVMYHQYGRTLEKIEDIVNSKKFRSWKTECIWYCGPTGVGKSHKLFTDYDPAKCYLWKDDKGWWDGYNGQEIVLIEEFRGGIPYHDLLQLTDKWPYNVSRRNRRPTPFLAKKIIITSALKPSEVYHNLHVKDSLEQLKRRIRLYKIHIKNGIPELLDDEI